MDKVASKFWIIVQKLLKLVQQWLNKAVDGLETVEGEVVKNNQKDSSSQDSASNVSKEASPKKESAKEPSKQDNPPSQAETSKKWTDKDTTSA